jgi:hypothetical protein
LRQTRLIKAAHRRECQLGIPGVCNGNPETTVLAHYRIVGTCVGIKPNDLQGAFPRSACHEACDGRDIARKYHAQGVMRTQAQLLHERLVSA